MPVTDFDVEERVFVDAGDLVLPAMVIRYVAREDEDVVEDEEDSKISSTVTKQSQTTELNACHSILINRFVDKEVKSHKFTHVSMST